MMIKRLLIVKIGVISDTHDAIENTEKAILNEERIDKMYWHGSGTGETFFLCCPHGELYS